MRNPDLRRTEALGAGDPGALEAMFATFDQEVARVALAEAYRRWGWRTASLDPLRPDSPEQLPELEPAKYGLTDQEAAELRRAYCGSIGWEIAHVGDAGRRQWLASMAETPWQPESAVRKRALDLIAAGECFEATLDSRLPGVKTFGLSGAEGFLVLLDRVLATGAAQGAAKAVIGGMHRGRLTQAALVLGKPLTQVIAEAQGAAAVSDSLGVSSDSPYHLGWTGDVVTSHGKLEIWLAPHPSHLSVVGPVAQGRARSAIETGVAVLPLVLHTDAAFAGQGVNAEMLQLSSLAPFNIGGTIHLILNNQVGFTTGAEEARSASNCATAGRMIDAPVLHVNGDDPDAILRVAEVAAGYRQAFGSDILVNLIAYRRKGHNEVDEPRLTQPGMYKTIDGQALLSARYASRIGARPDTSLLKSQLDAAFQAARDWRPGCTSASLGLSSDIEQQMLKRVMTGLPKDDLKALGARLTQVEEGICLHPKIADFVARRRTSLESGSIDWSTAEALAFASLLDLGTNVRLVGQDSLRGAFSQRHLQIHCQQSGKLFDVLGKFAGRASIHNTPLTETAVLAFEYGYTLGAQQGLTVWEAQFGDFLNVAQPVFDQFIICGEDRWLFESNIVLLLPHGVEGGGPDHATAHPERLLAACARGNIQVVNCSTPANYFHVLRRQVMAGWRKPLAVLAPKSLLRHSAARSALSDLDGCFRPVITDGRSRARRVVMSTGRLSVLLDQARGRKNLQDIALFRLEQLYPLDVDAIAEAVAAHPDAELVWAQDEPANFGYFTWLDRRLETATGRRWRLITRPASASASSGPRAWDDAHLNAVLTSALGL